MPKRKTRRIEGKHHDLIVSRNDAHGDTSDLVRLIEDCGVNVLSTSIEMPRHQLYCSKDGIDRYVHPDFDHQAWMGDLILRGDGFIIGSEDIQEAKMLGTMRELGVNKGLFYRIEDQLVAMYRTEVSGSRSFFSPKYGQKIDSVYNLGNRTRTLFTYFHPELIELGKKISRDARYDLVELPRWDAQYAAIGFIEIGDTIIIDRRAHESMKVIESLGYHVIPTPTPLKKTNRRFGSLRSMTAELTIPYESLTFFDIHAYETPKTSYKIAIENSRFWNSEGYKLRSHQPWVYVYDIIHKQKTGVWPWQRPLT